MVDVGAAFPSGGQASELVQESQSLFDDPADGLVVVAGAFPADQRRDPTFPELVAVGLVVVAAVGNEYIGLAARSPASPSHRRDRLDQRQQLGDVVPVAAGEGDGQRNAATVADQVVLRAGLASVDRARARGRAPLLARMWEASAHARDQSICPAAWSSASNTSCSRSKTPAACQSRRRRQQVIPDPNPSSCGRSSQPIPVNSTNKIPCSTRRSSSGFGPVLLAGCTGSNGSICSHNSSETIHGAAITKIIPAQDHQRVRGSECAAHRRGQGFDAGPWEEVGRNVQA